MKEDQDVIGKPGRGRNSLWVLHLPPKNIKQCHVIV